MCISLMTDKIGSVSNCKVFPLSKVAALITQLGATSLSCAAGVCCLSLHTQTTQKAELPECPSCWYPVWADGSKLVWPQQNKPGLVSLCRRHLRRWKTSPDLLPLCSCFIVLRHVTNIYHSACWQVMTQETSAHFFLENRDYYRIFSLTR